MNDFERMMKIAKRIERIRDNIAEHGIPDDKLQETENLVSELDKNITELGKFYQKEDEKNERR